MGQQVHASNLVGFRIQDSRVFIRRSIATIWFLLLVHTLQVLLILLTSDYKRIQQEMSCYASIALTCPID